jgi:hypothetical protein
MNRTLYILLLIFLAEVVTNAQVSSGKSISINVSATVVGNSPVELTTLNNMIIEGDINRMKEIYISPVKSPNAGLLRVKGRPNSQARMTYIINETLTDVNSTGKITLAYEMSGNPIRIQRASTLINTGEFILNFDNDGLYYLWLGVKIKLNHAYPGKYTGDFTVEIEYI